MKWWWWLLIVVVVAAAAFALGRYYSTLKTVYSNREKLGAAADIAGGLSTLLS
jgi:hypothetical protein